MSKRTHQVVEVVRDDREKKPWTPSFFGPGFVLWQQRLQTADYTIVGLEELVAIERKGNWAELYYDFTGARKPAFKKFLKRLQQFPVRMLIVEDDMADIAHVKVRGGFLPRGFMINAVLDIQLQYGIPVVPVGRSRRLSAPFIRALFRRIEDYHKRGLLHGEWEQVDG